MFFFLQAETTLADVGEQDVGDGTTIHLPPVLLGRIGDSDASKVCVCVYGHLDVQPAKKEDGWRTEPFQLKQIDGPCLAYVLVDDESSSTTCLACHKIAFHVTNRQDVWAWIDRR